jgi:hypothetical protein
VRCFWGSPAVVLPPETAVVAALAAEHELDVVDLLLVGVENAVVALGGGSGLLVLVEEREGVEIDVDIWVVRGARVDGQHAAHEVPWRPWTATRSPTR